MLSNNISFLFSPLDQFSNASWLSTTTFESLDAYSLLPSAREWDAWSLYTTSYASSSALSAAFATIGLSSVSLPLVVLALLFGPGILQRFNLLPANLPAVPSFSFSHLFLLATLHILTGAFFSVWFADLLIPTIPASFLALSSFETLAPALTFAPQLDISLYVDETLISLILAFFLLGTGEEEEDEDRLRAEEADLSRAEEVVAPIYFTNLGTTVAETAPLYLKVVALFSFVVANNLRGRLPYSDTATASLGLTFWVAFASFGSLITLRIRRHGVHYLFRLFRPSGTPFPLLFLLIPIEALSYTFRLVSLAVRLFANRRAGHSLRKILIGFAYTFLTLGDLYAVASFLPGIVVFVLVFLERAVAVVQAYIFTTLRARYRKDIYVAHLLKKCLNSILIFSKTFFSLLLLRFFLVLVMTKLKRMLLTDMLMHTSLRFTLLLVRRCVQKLTFLRRPHVLRY